jgi:DNA-binding NtrC family response regulator
LSEEALLAIGAQGTLSAKPQAVQGRLLDALRQQLGETQALSLPALEHQLLQETVAAADGNLAAAARQLGITRAQLAYRLQRAQAAPRRKKRTLPERNPG